MHVASARVLRRAAIATGIATLVLGVTAPAAYADRAKGHHLPNLVVLGDSFASGVGNPPNVPVDNPCKRSNSAYGPLLEAQHLVKLQAFVACSGATTEQVWGTGPNNVEAPQIDSITRDTDVVTVQALGNDFFVGAIERLCFTPPIPATNTTPAIPAIGCSFQTPFPVDTPLNGQTVGSVIGSIALLAPGKLETLYRKIDKKLGKHSDAQVITLGYPNIIGIGGPFCPGVTVEENGIAAKMVTDLNTAIKKVSRKHDYDYAPVEAVFQDHDGCGGLTGANPVAIYPPLPPGVGPASADPGGALHPNQLGQSLYAAAVAKQLDDNDHHRDDNESDDGDDE
jgi:lysophospholipase L1-like esterase